jgi:multicomponent Na+:H+ antiporter subunit D
MDTYFSVQPLIIILIPILASILIIGSWRWPNIREAWTLLAAVAMFGLCFSMLPSVLNGQYPQINLIPISPGVSISLKADTVGTLFALSASLLWIITSIYSIGYMRGNGEKKQTRYYASFALALASTMGIALSANLLTFFIFFECLTISTYPLILHKETPEAISGARKYLAYLLTGGLSLLIAIAITFYLTGALDFVPGGFLNISEGQGKLIAIFVLFTIGVGMKAALIPLHSWLPTAMVAPTPVSALLHAVAVVKAGVFGFVRVIGFVFGPELFHNIGAGYILAGLAGATIILSSLLALHQDNLKRRLAYSTIGHLSYIVLGVALLSPVAWMGGLLHIVNHAVMKITLFFCAGAIYVNTHIEKVSQLDGIGKKMPITMTAFAFAALGLAGIPPLNGFISKWFLGQGAVSADETIFMVILLISGLLNAAYLFPVVRRAFFNKSENHTQFGEASMFMVVPLVITAALSIFLGLMPNGIFHFYDLARNAISSIMGGGIL